MHLFSTKKLILYEHISWLAKDHFDIIKEKLALTNKYFFLINTFDPVMVLIFLI